MKKLQIHNTIILFALGLCAVKAQQTPAFTDYNYNPFIINAAYAGTHSEAEAVLSNSGFNNQIDGAPKNFYLSFNTAINEGKMGLGAFIMNDQIGVTNATQASIAYSYKLFFDFKSNRPYWQLYDRTVLSFGVTAGVLQYEENLLELGIQNDPNFAENINSALPAAGLSVLFGHGNFFAGVSVPNVLGDRLLNQDNLNLSRPIYGYTGYHFVMNKYNPSFIIKPSLLFKYENGAPFQVDTNISIRYKNNFEAGVGFRTSNSFNIAAGFYLFKNLRAMYNYTQGTGNSPLGSTHGILLSFRAGKGYQQI
ncbi:PorP/SprF family type IX secretion system membrane protein [Spongiivirga sp. MCCC 1A20706]|uniref:PorP/SprF family type IX secretion system membrane protein n=1 Tax=Spongiivirga sp. MCCC 1A20706 TaxID=3160963 RepID=UPI00397773EA